MNATPFKIAVPWLMPWLYPVTVGNMTHVEGTATFLAEYIAASVKRPIQFVNSMAVGYGNEISPGNWTGSIGMVLRGETDCLLGIYHPTVKSFPMFGYTSPIFESTFKILSGPPRKLHKVAGSLLSTVTKDVWIALLFTWIIVSLVSFLFAKAERCWFHKDVPRESLFKTMFAYYGLLFERGFDYTPNTDYCRLVLVGWLIICEVLMSGIGGSLSSKMSVRDEPERIDSIQDILDRPDLCVFIPSGIFIENFLKFSTAEIHQALWRRIESCDGIVEFDKLTSPEVLDQVNKGSAVIMGNSQFVLSETASRECRRQIRPLYLGKEGISSTPSTMIYRKNLDLPTAELYWRSALKVVEAGEIIKAQALNSRDAEPCYIESFIPPPLSAISLQNLVQVFQIWITGLGISVLVFIAEIFVDLGKKRTSVGLDEDIQP